MLLRSKYLLDLTNNLMAIFFFKRIQKINIFENSIIIVYIEDLLSKRLTF